MGKQLLPTINTRHHNGAKLYTKWWITYIASLGRLYMNPLRYAYPPFAIKFWRMVRASIIGILLLMGNSMRYPLPWTGPASVRSMTSYTSCRYLMSLKPSNTSLLTSLGQTLFMRIRTTFVPNSGISSYTARPASVVTFGRTRSMKASVDCCKNSKKCAGPLLWNSYVPLTISCARLYLKLIMNAFVYS